VRRKRRNPISTANIIDMTPDEAGGVTVTFSCHRSGNRSYHYSMPDSIAIMGGADPADFTPDSSGGSAGFGDIAAAGEIGEIGEIADIAELGAL
jgi:hypothetical protein